MSDWPGKHGKWDVKGEGGGRRMGFLENVEGDVVENVAREVEIKKMNKIFFLKTFLKKCLLFDG